MIRVTLAAVMLLTVGDRGVVMLRLLCLVSVHMICACVRRLCRRDHVLHPVAGHVLGIPFCAVVTVDASSNDIGRETKRRKTDTLTCIIVNLKHSNCVPCS